MLFNGKLPININKDPNIVKGNIVENPLFIDVITSFFNIISIAEKYLF